MFFQQLNDQLQFVYGIDQFHSIISSCLPTLICIIIVLSLRQLSQNTVHGSLVVERMHGVMFQCAECFERMFDLLQKYGIVREASGNIPRRPNCGKTEQINSERNQGSVVRRPDSAFHWIAIFSTFVKLVVDRYNLRLRFGIYKLKFLRSIVGSRSVVLQHFVQFYEGFIIIYSTVVVSRGRNLKFPNDGAHAPLNLYHHIQNIIKQREIRFYLQRQTTPHLLCLPQ